jgi:hypothetical protein
MNTKKFFLFLFTSIIGLSCVKETVTTVILPKFEGVTYLNKDGLVIGPIDTTDWRIDDKFEAYERKLFDTLLFDNTLHLKSSQLEIFDIKPNTNVLFYPNPFYEVGIFTYMQAAIMNIVVVDSTFAKRFETRTNDKTIALGMSSLEEGIYRMYYVFQDSNYRMIGLGHGDIMKKSQPWND